MCVQVALLKDRTSRETSVVGAYGTFPRNETSRRRVDVPSVSRSSAHESRVRKSLVGQNTVSRPVTVARDRSIGVRISRDRFGFKSPANRFKCFFNVFRDYSFTTVAFSTFSPSDTADEIRQRRVGDILMFSTSQYNKIDYSSTYPPTVILCALFCLIRVSQWFK